MAVRNFNSITSTVRMNSGYDMPVLGFGVYQTPPAETEQAVRHALEVGYRHVDSAAAYHNEAECASAIKASKIPREDIFFTSKVPPRDISYTGAKNSVSESLQKTGFSYIDLILLHAPFGGRENRIGAWRALVEAVKTGKVRSIGVSNYGTHHLQELEAWMSETESKEGKGKAGVLSVNQVELHPWLARPDIAKWCFDRGVVAQAWGPLARATRMGESVVQKIAKETGKTEAQVLVRWSLQKGFVPLPKSVNEERIKANCDVFDFKLAEDDMKSLDMGTYEPSGWDPTTNRD